MKRFLTSLIVIICLAPSILKAQLSQTVHFESNDITFNDSLADDGNTYTSVNISELMSSNKEGNPRLPVKYLNLIIPPGQTIESISILDTSGISFDLAFPIYPAQTPLSKCMECSEISFVYPDSTIYNLTNSWPESMINKIHQGFFDGCNNIVCIELCPFQYYPITGKLIYYTTISFELELVSGYPIGNSTRKRLAKNQAIYDESLRNLVDNPQDIPAYHTSPTMISQVMNNGPIPFYEYVIITKNDFIPAFDEFIEWKKQKGINIGAVSIEQIAENYDGDMIFPGHEITEEPDPKQEHAGKVRQYLYEAYNSGTTWALLAGDVTVMPARWGTSENINTDTTGWAWGLIIESDLYFADFTGDWNVDQDKYFGEPNDDNPEYYPEIYVGRLICSSFDDIKNWVHKVLIYEKNPGNGDYSYLTKSFMTQADYEFQWDPIHGQQAQFVELHLPTFTNNIWEEFPSYDDSISAWPRGADVVAELNNNHYGLMGCFNHGGSGDTNSGYATAQGAGYQYKIDAEEAFDYSKAVKEDADGLDNLTNYNYPFIIYSLSCVQNPYHLTKAIGNGGARNFGESFTVNNLAGGVAFLGTTSAAEPPITYLVFSKFADLITSTENQYSSHLGVAELISKYEYFDHYTTYSHNLIGCPETQIWSNSPSNFNVSLNHEYLNIGENYDIQVSINNLIENYDAIVCLYKKDELQETRTVTGDFNQSAIATFNNIVLLSDGELRITVTSYNYIPYTKTIPVAIIVDEDETWNSDRTIDNNILITSCATLTIHSVISMKYQKKIMVTQCSKLILDGGVLTDNDNSTWQGVEVWGNTNEHQYTINQQCFQGKIELQNEAVIENANNAVTLWKPGDWNTRGGIIIAKDAQFINNRRSVEFMSYQNFHPITELHTDNLSSFSNCLFEVNLEYHLASSFYSHISLWEVDGINIKGCRFINDNIEFNDSGYGIYSMDAGYRLSDYCDAYIQPCPEEYITHCEFNNLYAGVSALNSGSERTIYINGTVFNNNGYGVQINAVDNITIIFNEFNIGENYKETDVCNKNFGIGIELTNCNGYAVEQNTFHSASGMLGYTIGVRVNYEEWFTSQIKKTQSNQFYKNSFDGLYIASEFEGFNFNQDDMCGLTFSCNENEYNFLDYYINGDGVMVFQGDMDLPAGNTFSFSSSNPYSDLNNQANWSFLYFYDVGNTNETPVNYSSKVIPLPISYTNPCSSHYTGGNNSQIDGCGLTTSQYNYFYQYFNSNMSAYNSVNDLYEELKDGGDTEGTKDEIENAWPDEMWEMRSLLLDLSPHLSTDILMEVANRTDLFPDAIIFEILSANPDAMKDEQFLKYLETKENPLPTYMISMLRTITSTISYKTILEAQLNSHISKATFASNVIIRNMLNDSISNYDSIYSWLSKMNSPIYDFQIIDLLIQIRNTYEAQSELYAMPAKYNFTGDDLAEYEYFKQLKELEIQLINEGKNVFLLTDSQINMLDTIAENSIGRSKSQARNILQFVKDYSFSNCPKFPDSVTFKRGSNLYNNDSKSYINFNIEPNPARLWTSFKINLPKGTSEALIEIRDPRGILIQSYNIYEIEKQIVWDVREVPNGIYFVQIITKLERKTMKLIINH